MISLVLVGALGRMGRAIEGAANEAEDVRIKARVDRPALHGSGGPEGGSAVYKATGVVTQAQADVRPVEELSALVAPGDVVIEFSSPEGCRHAARVCAERGVGLVSGTTGLGPEEEKALEQAARRVPVLRSSNFSLGVLALRRALAAALEALPKEWDIEIVERHHRLKADSPSGTALTLARQAAESRGLSIGAFRFGRQGSEGPRPVGEIGIHAVRGGSWTGDHEILLAGPGEWLEIRHVAQERSAFAHGVLAAARFLAGAGPGLYTLEDVLSAVRRAV